MSKRKLPTNKVKPHPQKKPLIDPHNQPEKISSRRPVWRIAFLDFDGPWGWGELEGLSLFKSIHDKLRNFETMTWAEIDRYGSHTIDVKNISKEAKQRLKEISQDDLDQLFSFRLSAKERLWGIRKEEILYMLWWDPEHTVYPVSKKNT